MCTPSTVYYNVIASFEFNCHRPGRNVGGRALVAESPLRQLSALPRIVIGTLEYYILMIYIIAHGRWVCRSGEACRGRGGVLVRTPCVWWSRAMYAGGAAVWLERGSTHVVLPVALLT